MHDLSIKYYVLYGVIAIVLGTFCIETTPVSYDIEVLHPGVSRTDKVDQVLYKVDHPYTQFYMNVATVVCGDDQCKIDTISIYWDSLGFYDRIELPNGVALEKAEGTHFSLEDYEKLDKILSNRSSSLESVYKEEVVGTVSSDAVDGVSGATIILNTNDYIAGAVWTCYTLWHWANGDIHHIIRDIHGSELALSVLIMGLQSKFTKERHFCLEQIQHRGIHTKRILESLLCDTQSIDDPYAKLIVDYVKSSDDNAFFFKAIASCIQRIPKVHRFRFLSALNSHSKTPKSSFVDRLIKMIEDDASFQEVDLFLQYVEQHENAIDRSIPYALGLLQNKSFIIARRAYWFLDNQALSKSQKKG